MFLTVLISLGSLIILISLHELGHFLTAKKFGVKVEEFGIGYPPRLFGSPRARARRKLIPKARGQAARTIGITPDGGDTLHVTL